MITTLPPDLAPMPIGVPEERVPSDARVCGFVDEEAVTALLSGPSDRIAMPFSGLILRAEDDFAGWPTATARTPVSTPPARKLEVPFRDGAGRRSWITGFTGGCSAMLFTLLLMTSAWRPEPVVLPNAPAAPPSAAPPATELAGR